VKIGMTSSLGIQVGTLSGFDEYVNAVLDDVLEISVTANGPIVEHRPQILLNGNNICFVVPGANPYADAISN